MRWGRGQDWSRLVGMSSEVCGGGADGKFVKMEEKFQRKTLELYLSTRVSLFEWVGVKANTEDKKNDDGKNNRGGKLFIQAYSLACKFDNQADF